MEHCSRKDSTHEVDTVDHTKEPYNNSVSAKDLTSAS